MPSPRWIAEVKAEIFLSTSQLLLFFLRLATRCAHQSRRRGGKTRPLRNTECEARHEKRMKSFDFLVIGAGISGASAACSLAELGRTLLLEGESMPG